MLGGWAGTRTAEELAGLGDDVFNVDGRLLGFCGDVAACGGDDEGVRLAIPVFDVEAAKEHSGSRNDTLAELETLAELGYDCRRRVSRVKALPHATQLSQYRIVEVSYANDGKDLRLTK
jgi:hypothetical protein